MAGFLGQIAQSAGAAAGAGGMGPIANIGSAVASNFLQPFFDNYYQDATTGNRAENYNKYADMTYPEDSRRMLNRMDTLYPGTTPWERLGIQPASSPSLPDSKAPGSAPFLLAQMQQDTALKTTQMNNTTAEKIANINAGVSTRNTDVTTATQLEIQRVQNAFQLPAQQAEIALKAAQALSAAEDPALKRAQGAAARASAAQSAATTKATLEKLPQEISNLIETGDLINAQKNRTDLGAKLDAIASVVPFLPKSTYQAGGRTYTGIEGFEKLDMSKVLTNSSSPLTGMWLAEQLQKMKPSEANNFLNGAITWLGAVKTTADTAASVGDGISSFLGKAVRPHTTKGDRAFYNRDGEVMGGVSTTTTTR